mmetsp:Transcript_20724/g.65358  ORF Transcript_20724/g.65358 Transcript_20724/m.65358 type:complete len:221 (-) Transcript_20724:857-1519(-)
MRLRAEAGAAPPRRTGAGGSRNRRRACAGRAPRPRWGPAAWAGARRAPPPRSGRQPCRPLQPQSRGCKTCAARQQTGPPGHPRPLAHPPGSRRRRPGRRRRGPGQRGGARSWWAPPPRHSRGGRPPPPHPRESHPAWWSDRQSLPRPQRWCESPPAAAGAHARHPPRRRRARAGVRPRPRARRAAGPRRVAPPAPPACTWQAWPSAAAQRPLARPGPQRG